MSRPNIKFVYTGQIRSQVYQLQKGPANLQNLYTSILNPQYQQINKQINSQSNANNPNAISNVQIQSKQPSTSSLIRYKSVENIKIGRNEEDFSRSNPTLNIEQTNQSQVKFVNQSAQQFKKTNKNAQSDQIVLKAPSYKFTPRDEGQIAVHSKKQYKKTGSVGKSLNAQSNLKSKKSPRNANTQKQIQLKSSNPVFKIDVVKESEFLRQQSRHTQPQPRQNINFDQIILKAPKYKYTPRQDGNIAVNRKKEYVKAEYAEKYLYQGVQKDSENDFIGCFGCGKPKPKVYSTQQEN